MSNGRIYKTSVVHDENIHPVYLHYVMFDGNLMEMLRGKMPLLTAKGMRRTKKRCPPYSFNGVKLELQNHRAILINDIQYIFSKC